MTPEQLQAQAVEMAKAGKSAVTIAQFFVDNNINAETAAEAAQVLVAEYAPIAEAPSQDEFFESEVARLREILNQKCEKYFDPVAVERTISEWAEGLFEDVWEFNIRETPMDEIFGKKVRLKNSGQGTDGVLVDHGVVGANLFFYDAENKPLFYGLDHVKSPSSFDYNTDEEYRLAKQQHIEDDNKRYHLRKQLAGTFFVRWFDKNGNQQCQGWHSRESLEWLE